MAVIISKEMFDPWRDLQHYQEALPIAGQFGATSVFVGTMRNFNQGDTVTGMSLDYYPGMTEKQLEKIVAEAIQRWPVLEALVVHRVGDILPNEPIVLVAVWTAHRGDAFEACRHIMEELKTKAPFWKKELLASGGGYWVAANTSGYQT